MKSVTVKSPTRVDLAGGTLDLWPLYAFIGPCQTINLAISVWTQATLEARSDQRIEIQSEDVGLNISFENKAAFIASTEPKLKLFQVIGEFMNPDRGFALKTTSQSPVGGGLGGSSSLMVSILKAFGQIFGPRWQNVAELVTLAHNLEARILVTPTGTQDYFPAASGGMNILKYDDLGVTQRVEKLKGSEIESAFLLVYTGRSHQSGLNNFEVLKSAVGKDQKVLDALRSLQKVAEKMALCLQNGGYGDMPELLRMEYEARIRLTPAFTSPEIEKLRQIAHDGRATPKICGAGGGGCVLLWAPENKQKVAEQCQRAGFQIINASLVDPLI